jgi:hypothetical protein
MLTSTYLDVVYHFLCATSVCDCQNSEWEISQAKFSGHH